MLKTLKIFGYLGLGLFLYVWYTDNLITAVIYVVLICLLLFGLLIGLFVAAEYVMQVRKDFDNKQLEQKRKEHDELLKDYQSSRVSFKEHAPVYAFLYPVCKLIVDWFESVNKQMDLEEKYGEGAKVVQTKNGTTVIIKQKRESSGTGVSGFVFSILALILGWIPVVGWLLWFLGALLSFIGLFFSGGRIYAVLGFIISFIGVIVWGAAILAIFSAIGAFSN